MAATIHYAQAGESKRREEANGPQIQEVWETQGLYEEIVRSMAAGIVVSDVHGCCTFVNHSAAAMLGYTPEELAGRHWTAIVPAAQWATVQAACQRRMQGHEEQYELELLHKEGSQILVLVASRPLFDRVTGRFAGSLINLLKIGQRAEAKAETCQRAVRDEAVDYRSFSSEEVADQVSDALVGIRWEEVQRRLSIAVEQTAEAVVMTDTDGIILYANPAFEESSGYYRTEIIGQHLRKLCGTMRDGGLPHEMWQALRAGQTWKARVKCRRKDGSLYTTDMTISPVRDAAGRIEHHIATMRDVTREVQLEEQFRQVQKMEAVGRLAGGIAHDFNNVLTIIHISTGLLERKLHGDDSLAEYVQRIRQAEEHATGLTRQLLAFSRREIVEPQVLNLNKVLADLAKMLRRILREDIELEMALADDLWPVTMDPTQVEQIVVNLAVNAHDAMPQGGCLTIETANVVCDTAFVTHHLDVQPGEYVMLAVNDTGVGMDDEVKGRLFEPFFTTKEPGKGTGFGLATVYGIVKQNKGHIRVQSEMGQGTAFRIYLPSTSDAMVDGSGSWPVARPRAADPEPGGAETILLVEDDASLRELMIKILETWGYRVMAAENGADALRLAQEYQDTIHLLLADVVMPRMSGKELATRLRCQRPGMRVLYMSGHTDDVIGHHGVLEPGTAFLGKPLSVESLVRKVRAVLDKGMECASQAG